MPRILIVEDEQDLRETLARFLERENFIVLKADGGNSGFETAVHQKPDLILLDVRMPDISGYQMLRKLRDSGDWGQKVPVIFLTNLTLNTDEEHAAIEGTEPLEYIIKSEVDPDEVVRLIRKHLGR